MSARQGNMFAQRNLSWQYLEGSGVEKNLQQMEYWLRKAAEGGFALAQYEYGLRSLSGKDVEKQLSAALDWLRMSAEQGFVPAAVCLSRIYLSGDEVTKNVSKAIEFVWRPAADGDADAQLLLGLCNLELEGGFDQGPTAAVTLFRKSAEQGNALAQVCLGVCYRDGVGVKRNVAEAIKWYRIAAEKGNADAAKALVELKDNSPMANNVISQMEEAAENASFSVRGFYLGMKLSDAMVMLRHRFPKGKIECTSKTADGFDTGIVLNGLNMHFCDADENGIVKRISLDKKIIRAWYKESPKDADEWWKWFADKNGLSYKSEVLEGERRISDPTVLGGRLLGHSEVSQKCFVSTSRKGIVIRYFGKMTATDLSPHWSNADDPVIAGTVMAGRDAAREWPEKGWVNMQGGAEGSLRIEFDKDEPEGDEWETK